MTASFEVPFSGTMFLNQKQNYSMLSHALLERGLVNRHGLARSA